MSATDGEKREESKNNIKNAKKHQKTPKNTKHTQKHPKNTKKNTKTHKTRGCFDRRPDKKHKNT